MFNLYVVRICFDFGLLILIWMTQLVVYPSFQYYSHSDLKNWHSKYTTRITILVMPLMTGQLFLHLMSAYQESNWVGVLSLGIIATVWVNTFFFAVPIHNQIDKQKPDQLIPKLIRVNWYRTIAWTIVFLITALSGKS